MSNTINNGSITKKTLLGDLLIGNTSNIKFYKQEISDYNERKQHWIKIYNNTETTKEDKEIASKKMKKYDDLVEKANKKIETIQKWLRQKE